MSRTGRRLLLALASGLLSLGALEVVGRLALPEGADSHPFQSQALAGWTLPAGETFQHMGHEVRVNSWGLRGPEPERPRWLALGDSTVFGHGVADEETLPAQLSRTLGVQVLNGGVPGYTCAQARDQRSRLSELGAHGLLLYLMISDSFHPHPSDKVWLPDLPLRELGLGRLAVSVAAWRGQHRGRRVEPEDFADCLRALGAEHDGPVVFVIPVTDEAARGRPEPELEPYREAISRIAAERGPLVDPAPTFEADPRGVERLMADPVHPSAEGLALIAGALAETISALEER